MHIIRADGKFKLNEKIKNLVLPGFDGIPIREVFEFVIRGFRKGVLVTRASSIAFNLLMAILPATIFLFTLIPFIPIPNFQQELIKLFESILPVECLLSYGKHNYRYSYKQKRGSSASHVLRYYNFLHKWHTCSSQCISW